MEEREEEEALGEGWAWRNGPRIVRLRIILWLTWMRAWLHRLWLIPIADGVPDPFLHVARCIPAQTATYRASFATIPRLLVRALRNSLLCAWSSDAARGGMASDGAGGYGCTRTSSRAR